MARRFILTRDDALMRLAQAVPHTGHTYANTRNSAPGPGAPPTTSELSPYLRRRLLLEEEAVAAALTAHGQIASAKFVEEVFWRTYFKGYLETRPSIWTRYCLALKVEQKRLTENSGLRRAYEEAVSGRAGIDGFDEWARALVQDGWLHNHVRMWFASIWIFTLGLPWQLGADFFLRHLLDGDPASNTLSWRWVAGLHTRGKPYAARAENIHRYTAGRFSPAGLNEQPVPLQEPDAPVTARIANADTAPASDVALLLHLDDLKPESLPLGRAKVRRVGGLLVHAAGAVERVREADREAMSDALARAGARFGCDAVAAEPGWNNAMPVVTAWAPVGPSAEALPPGCLRLRRAWDESAWPHATKGYTQVKTAIPDILRTASVAW